jgi:YD repeat-containing protein
VTDSSGASVTNWFNNKGLQYAVSNAFGQVSALAFDLHYRVTNSVDANAVSVSMTYDDLGRLRTRTYPDSSVERFGYSAKGLVAFTNLAGGGKHALHPCGISASGCLCELFAG